MSRNRRQNLLLSGTNDGNKMFLQSLPRLLLVSNLHPVSLK